MAGERKNGSRRGRAFRPTLDGTVPLEPRKLLSRITIPGPGPIRFQVGAAGSRLRVIDTDGEIYDVLVEGQGKVRGTRAPGGRVNLFIDGTNPDSQVTINPVAVRQQGLAHTYPPGARLRDNLLHLNSVTVTSGMVNAILGYRTATLGGPLVVPGDTPVDRIAFTEIRPGGSIRVGNDLNTLDVIDGVTLDGGPGIQVGRDFNWMSVGGDVVLRNGADITIGRDLGLVNQGNKGTGIGGQGARIVGNLVINPGSELTVGRNLAGTLAVLGNLDGASRVSIPTVSGNVIVLGTITA